MSSVAPPMETMTLIRETRCALSRGPFDASIHHKYHRYDPGCVDDNVDDRSERPDSSAFDGSAAAADMAYRQVAGDDEDALSAATTGDESTAPPGFLKDDVREIIRLCSPEPPMKPTQYSLLSY